jgi:methylmalonyl-CoA mutase cobalamin-binding domain/chain
VPDNVEDELDLSSLNDEDLTLQVHDDLYNGLREEVMEATNILLSRGWGPERVLNDALVEGMRIVGIDFRDGILFVPEVLLAANAMKGGMEILRPLLAETGVEPIGKMVIGTVKGDIHDIGKNLVAMMMEGAGFEVIDLGINNPVEKYLAALAEHKPDILGLSALLTTTMPYMKVVIDTMKDQGIRDDYIVLVGGAPLNEAFGKAVGADAYCRDAAIAVETAKALIAMRRAMRVPPIDGMTRVLVAPKQPVLGARHRLRRARSRDRGLASRQRVAASRREVPARGIAQSARAHPGAVRDAIRAGRDRYATIFVAYGDCGTGGLLDVVLAEEGVERIPGAHCYEFFAGSAAFETMSDDEPGHVLRHRFPAPAFRPPGDSRPGPRSPSGARAAILRPLPAPHLSRAGRAPERIAAARAAADRLGLAFAHRVTGYGGLERSLRATVARMPAWQS